MKGALDGLGLHLRAVVGALILDGDGGFRAGGVGMAGAAHADSPTSAGDQVSSPQAEGTHVVVTKDNTDPLAQCSVVSVRQDHPHEHRGGPQHDEFHTAYVDLSCH